MISAGIEYAKGNGDLTLLATKSDTNYGSWGAALNALGLANTVVFHNFNLSYTRTINPNLSVTGQLGLVGVTNAFTLGLPKTLLPTFSLAGSWAITPKVTLLATLGVRTQRPVNSECPRRLGRRPGSARAKVRAARQRRRRL